MTGRRLEGLTHGVDLASREWPDPSLARITVVTSRAPPPGTALIAGGRGERYAALDALEGSEARNSAGTFGEHRPPVSHPARIKLGKRLRLGPTCSPPSVGEEVAPFGVANRPPRLISRIEQESDDQVSVCAAPCASIRRVARCFALSGDDSIFGSCHQAGLLQEAFIVGEDYGEDRGLILIE